MSELVTALPSVSGAQPTFRRCVFAGVAGLFWVLVNLLLVWLGVTTGHKVPTSIASGGVNGMVFSVIALTRMGDRFRSAATGLLGGISLSGFRKDATIVRYFANSIRTSVDSAMTGLDLAADAKWHQSLEDYIVWTVWVTIIVVLAALVAEWTTMAWGADTADSRS